MLALNGPSAQIVTTSRRRTGCNLAPPGFELVPPTMTTERAGAPERRINFEVPSTRCYACGCQSGHQVVGSSSTTSHQHKIAPDKGRDPTSGRKGLRYPTSFQHCCFIQIVLILFRETPDISAHRFRPAVLDRCSSSLEPGRTAEFGLRWVWASCLAVAWEKPFGWSSREYWFANPRYNHPRYKRAGAQ